MTVRFARPALIAVAAALVSSGCTLQEAPHADSTAVNAAAQKAARTWNPDTYKAPAVDSTPDDQFETSAFRGLAILTKTRDSLPDYVGGNLNCVSCHLDEGRRPNAAPLIGVALAGLGAVCVPAMMAQSHIERGALVPVLKEYMPRDLWLYAAYAQRRHNSAALQLDQVIGAPQEQRVVVFDQQRMAGVDEVAEALEQTGDVGRV